MHATTVVMEDAPPATEGDRLIAALEGLGRGEWPTSPLIERVKALHEITVRKERYRELRREHPEASAITLWRWAKLPNVAYPELEWEEESNGMSITASFERDGFDITVKMVFDEHAQPDGVFTDDPPPNAQLHLCPDQRCDPYSRESGRYAYYLPEGVDFDDFFEWTRKHHSKHESWVLARTHVLDAVKQETSDERAVYGGVVEVKRRGVDLGQASLWGMEFSERAYSLNDKMCREAEDFIFSNGLINEAVEQAKETLADLLD